MPIIPNPKNTVNFSKSQFQLNNPDLPIQSAVQNAISDWFNQLIKNKITLTDSNTNQPYSDIDLINDMSDLLIDFANDNDLSIKLNDLFNNLANTNNQNAKNWKNIIANSILQNANLDLPSADIIYTYNYDIKTPAQNYRNQPNQTTKADLINGLIGYLLQKPVNNQALFILTNETQYNQFKAQLNTLKTITAKLNKQISEIQNIKFEKNEATTSWITGTDISPKTLNRELLAKITQFQNDNFKVLPLNLKTFVQPLSFVFINQDRLDLESNDRFNTELTELATATNKLQTFNIKSLKKVQTAEDVNTEAKKNSHRNATGSNIKFAKHQSVAYKHEQPSNQQMLNYIKAMINRKMTNQTSQNSFTSIGYSYRRPNRRRPNNQFVKGHIGKKLYRPDIHIYLDSSGSISESQYRQGILTLIKLAKLLKTDLYLTSFSNYITEPVKLKTQNRSVKAIYQSILKLPKAGGGTEFVNVWRLIDKIAKHNHSIGQAQQFNFILTDFEYWITDAYVIKPNLASTKQTFYLPLAANNQQYKNAVNSAYRFANQMKLHGDKLIDRRILIPKTYH